MGNFINELRRAFEFSGRSTRAQFGYYILIVLIIKAFALLIDFGVNDRGPFFITIVSVIFFVPSISAAVRRLHDTGRPGLWVLFFFVPIFGLILLFVLAEPSTEGPNRFGPSPHAEPALGVAHPRRSAFQDRDITAEDRVPRWENQKKSSSPPAAGPTDALSPPVPSAVQSAVKAMGNDTLEKLERIAALKRSGALTQDEFELLKRRALDG